MHQLEHSIYEGRHAQLRRLMREKDLRAVLSLDADNINYLTGYWLGSAFFGTWERPAFSILPRDGEPMLLLNEIFTNSIRDAVKRGSCVAADARFYAEAPNVRGEPTSWRDALKALLSERNLSGRLGVDTGGSVLMQALADIGVKVQAEPVDEDLRDMRYIKHPQELRLIRLMSDLSDWAQDVFKANLRRGRSCPEVSAITLAQLTEKAVELYPEDKIDLKVFCHAGPDSANIPNAAHYYGRKVQDGDSVINIIICRLNGYVAENERSFLVGQPSDQLGQLADAVVRAQSAAIGACVTGNPIADIDRRSRAVLTDAGFGAYVYHRAGHGIGLAGHEYPLDTAFNMRHLAARSVFSCEPAAYVPEVGGFRHSDTVVVGEDAPEVLTRYPRDLASLAI